MGRPDGCPGCGEWGCGDSHACVPNLLRKNAKLRERVAELEDALVLHGEHRKSCRIQTYPHDPDLPLHPCTCGLDGLRGGIVLAKAVQDKPGVADKVRALVVPGDTD